VGTDTAERLGLNGRFGPVEDRRNNHKACHSYLYSPDLVAVAFRTPLCDRSPIFIPLIFKFVWPSAHQSGKSLFQLCFVFQSNRDTFC